MTRFGNSSQRRGQGGTSRDHAPQVLARSLLGGVPCSTGCVRGQVGGCVRGHVGVRLRDMNTPVLPGADLIEMGLASLARGEATEESLLVSIAAERLRSLGIDIPVPQPDPEIRLFQLLAAEHGDAAHGRYNALVRRLVSFQRAAACAR